MSETARKKILVVEDDKDFMWLLRQGFENKGFDMVYAQSGEEALLLAVKENPDLILMDISLPGMDGIEAVKQIKDKGVLAKVIFLTNLNDVTHVSDALNVAGESDYIVKADIHIDAIVKRVEDKLEMKS